jgi:hypothetical protein
MESGQNNGPENISATPPLSAGRAAWGRRLAVAAAVLFFISSAFPVVAGVTKNTESFPKLWGMLDVGLAFVLVILAFAIMTLAGKKVSREVVDASYRAYRVLNHGILVLVVVFFVFGDRIVWIHCITGFAWRAWLLGYILPAWITALGKSAAGQIPVAG